MATARILVVDRDYSSAEEVGLALMGFDFEVHGATSAFEAMRTLESGDYDGVLIEVCLPDVDGIELVRTVCHRHPTLLPILTASEPTVESAAAAVRVGAFDYVLKPMDTVRLRQVILEAVEAKRILDRRPSVLGEAADLTESAYA